MAIEEILAKAEQGNARAQCKLGVCYKQGQGVKQDYEKAKEYLNKALKNLGDVKIKESVKKCLDDIERESRKKEELRMQHLMTQGRCPYCGGEFKGFFVKKCTGCGRKKDY